MAAGLLIRGALTVAFLAASYFLRPSTNIERGRVNQIPIQQSDYGSMIPIAFGEPRLSGNIVWSSGLKKTESTESAGKGLGGRNTVTTFTYFADIAVMLCKNVAGSRIREIRRIWADGKLIYDISGESSVVQKEGLVFRLLDGNKNQQPDSLIQTDVDGRLGTGSTPAYRGRGMVVFDNLNLTDFGNRIPNLSFEVTMDNNSTTGEPTMNFSEGTLVSGKNTANSTSMIDWDRGLIFLGGTGGVGGDDNRTLVGAIGSLEPLRIVDRRMADSGPAIDPTDGTVVSKVGASTNMGRWNPVTGSVIAQDNIGFGTGEGRKAAVHRAGSDTVFITGDRTTVGLNPFRFTVFNRSIGVIDRVDRPDTTYGLIPPTSGGSVGESIFGFENTSEIRIHGVGTNPTSAAVAALPETSNGNGTIKFGLITTLTPATFGGTAFSGSVGFAYIRSSGDILIAFTMDSQPYLARYNFSSGVLWQTSLGAAAQPNSTNMSACRLTSTTFGQMYNNGEVLATKGRCLLIDVVTGQIDPLYNGVNLVTGMPQGGANFGGNHDSYFWDETTRSFYGTPDTTVSSNQSRVRRYRFGSTNDGEFSGNSVSLADIVSDLNQEVELEIIEDYDVSELVAQQVPAYIVSTQQPARSSIEPLADIYFFDGVESDYALRYRTRGRSTTAFITEDQMVRLTDGEPFTRTRVQEAEIPRSVQVNVFDPDNAHQKSTQQAQRVRHPVQTVASANVQTIDVPASIFVDDAKQAAEKILFTRWNERTGLDFRTSWEFIAIDPSDVAQITFDDGLVLTERMEEANSGADFSVELRGVVQGEGQYTSTVSGGSGENLQVTIPNVLPSQLFLLDVPLLQDTDSPTTGSGRMYWAGNNFTSDDWGGGVLLESEDLSTFQNRGAQPTGAPWGVTTIALDPPSSFHTWDNDNTITLSVVNGAGSFSSSTDDGLLTSFANALAVFRGDTERSVEIIQFRDVTVNGDGTITLSRLLRGRKGTEIFGETQFPAGSTVVLLTTSSVTSFLDAATEAGSAHQYKLVSVGQANTDALVESYTPTLRSLRPWTLEQLTATTNASDIDLAAVRRTRFGGELQDGTGTVPLNEDSEEYELEILNAAGDTVLRTVTGLTTPFYKYLSADITTDFGSPPATINLRWYQVSAQVGRGFTRLTNVTVE